MTTARGEAGRSAEAPPDAPARDLQTEQTLCWAITQLRQVAFTYRKDATRVHFQPTVLYLSSSGKANIGGTVVRKSAAAGTARERHVFEVARIGGLVVTSIRFDPDPLFDRRDERYEAGIICPN
jgi:hypothetical protein